MAFIMSISKPVSAVMCTSFLLVLFSFSDSEKHAENQCVFVN